MTLKFEGMFVAGLNAVITHFTPKKTVLRTKKDNLGRFSINSDMAR